MATGIQIDSITASVGNGVPWAYGRHIVAGNVLLRDDTDPDFPVLFIGLGEGEWDGYEVDGSGDPLLFLNGVQLQASQVHFHPGTDGQLSSGTAGDLTPVSTGGDQKVDLWFPLVNSANGAISTSLVANITSGASTLQAVSSANFNVGDQFTIDSEDMLIQAIDIGAGTWTVLRAINGTAAAAHTAATTINLKSSIQPLTFSRLAYIAIRFDASIIDPSGNDFRGFFRTRKVGIYNGSGTLTGTQYSESPSWQILDMLLNARRWPSTKIDYPAFVQFASDCATLITVGVNQVPRFVSHMVFASPTDFGSALEAMLMNCRGVMSEYNGIISIRMDQVRAPVFAFNQDNIVRGSFQHSFLDTRTAANQMVMTFRDTDSGLAVASIPFDDEAQQERTGRIVPAQMTLGNMPQHQAERVANFQLTKNIDLNEQVNLSGTEATVGLMPGDVVTVEYDAAPWSVAGAGQETFEITEATDEPNGTRNFIMRLYRDETYSDDAGVPQNLAQTTVNKHWLTTGNEPRP